MKLCVQAIYIYFPFLIPQRYIWVKKKALSGFLFVHLVTLPGGPGHAGDGEDGGDGVDAHARVEGLGRVGLAVSSGSRVVVVARRGLQHGNPLSDSVGHDLGIISDHLVCLYTLGSIHRRGNRVVLHFNDDFGGIRFRIQRATVCLYIIIQQIAGTCDGVVTDANIRCAASLRLQ